MARVPFGLAERQTSSLSPVNRSPLQVVSHSSAQAATSSAHQTSSELPLLDLIDFFFQQETRQKHIVASWCVLMWKHSSGAKVEFASPFLLCSFLFPPKCKFLKFSMSLLAFFRNDENVAIKRKSLEFYFLST